MRAAVMEAVRQPLVIRDMPMPTMDDHAVLPRIEATCQNAVATPRRRGRHPQVGMTSAAERGEIALPIDVIVGNELQVLGSSGMAAPRYGPMLRMVEAGKLNPAALVTRTIPLEDAGDVLASMTTFGTVGVTVVDRY